MTLHYIKVAFRNLWKYKAQNIISVIGLAVGLLCFSVCMYVLQPFCRIHQSLF